MRKAYEKEITSILMKMKETAKEKNKKKNKEGITYKRK